MNSIRSGGGPLVCMERQFAEQWSGVAGGVAEASDYARACAVRDHLGKLSVAGSDVLILGDMPLETTIWQPAGRLPCIVRIYYADPGVDLMVLLQARGDAVLSRPLETLLFEVGSPALMIFDSAYPGSDESVDRLDFCVEPGKYRVITCELEPDDRTKVLLHTFQALH